MGPEQRNGDGPEENVRNECTVRMGNLPEATPESGKGLATITCLNLQRILTEMYLRQTGDVWKQDQKRRRSMHLGTVSRLFCVFGIEEGTPGRVQEAGCVPGYRTGKVN